jgi:hypothetical protein
MNPFQRLREQVRGWWMGPMNSGDPALASFFNMGQTNRAGVQVSEETALTYSVFWACVNAISSGRCERPLILYKRRKRAAKALHRLKLYQLLPRRAQSRDETAMSFRRTLTAHADVGEQLRGNPARWRRASICALADHANRVQVRDRAWAESCRVSRRMGPTSLIRSTCCMSLASASMGWSAVP